MRVVVTGTRGIPMIMGGVETHVEQLFPRIAAEGVDVTVIRRSNYVTNQSEEEISLSRDGSGVVKEWKDVKLIDIDSPKKKSFEAIIHTFRAINRAKKLHADIIHIHAIGPGLLTPYAKMLGLKVVFTHHGPDYDREKWGFAAKTILRLGEWSACKFADDVIVISNVIKDLVAEKHGRTKNVHLIYNGVPEPCVETDSDYLKSLGIESRKFILGMCRFVPEKRLDDLVHAYVHLRQKNLIPSDIQLVLAGDTDFEDNYSLSLKRAASEKGVVLTGFVKGRRLHTLLSNARCFVLPSSHEGLPIALLEAMSYKLPVIVSDIPANTEVGLNSISYFPCQNVERLENRLQTLLSKDFAEEPYEMSKYNWDSIAKQLLNVYKTLINR